MKRRSHAKQRDLNEPEIVEALRRCGFRVHLLDEPVDLLVGGMRQTWLLEVKRGDLAPSSRQLTDDEAEFFRDWRGAPPLVVRSRDEALCVVRAIPCPTEPRDYQRRRADNVACGCGGIVDPAWFTAARNAAKAARR